MREEGPPLPAPPGARPPVFNVSNKTLLKTAQGSVCRGFCSWGGRGPVPPPFFFFFSSFFLSLLLGMKTKNKDTKDKEKLNRHNFTNGTFSGVIPCMACEKALLGKESLQCSCK